MTDTKDKDKKHTTCPFSKLKSSKLKSSKLKNPKKTPCPVINALINMDYLDPNDEWKKEEVQNALKKIKMSGLTSFLLTNSIHNTLKKQNLPFTVKSLQKHNVIEHDASISREDYHLGDNIMFNKKRFNLIYKYFNNQKKITLKEFTEYRYHLYKKSRKENNDFIFGSKEYSSTLAETCAIFILLSHDGYLHLHKLQKVFEEETLDNVKINSINAVNFSINFLKCVNYWMIASIN
jgi:hypothetical protein